jgi:pyruvate formate lyase activating enzyme
VIDDRERGYCGVRENRGGAYYTLVHSRVCAAHVDPIEKKPFFHFHPGTLAFSIATAGCNVNCKMCQNWEISQVRPEQGKRHLHTQRAAEIAKESRCSAIAYTYSEPVIFSVPADVAWTRRGDRSAVLTGRYTSAEPLKELCGQWIR